MLLPTFDTQPLIKLLDFSLYVISHAAAPYIKFGLLAIIAVLALPHPCKATLYVPSPY